MGDVQRSDKQHDKREETVSARRAPVVICSVGLFVVGGQKDFVAMTR